MGSAYELRQTKATLKIWAFLALKSQDLANMATHSLQLTEEDKSKHLLAFMQAWKS